MEHWCMYVHINVTIPIFFHRSYIHLRIRNWCVVEIQANMWHHLAKQDSVLFWSSLYSQSVTFFVVFCFQVGAYLLWFRGGLRRDKPGRWPEVVCPQLWDRHVLPLAGVRGKFSANKQLPGLSWRWLNELSAMLKSLDVIAFIIH